MAGTIGLITYMDASRREDLLDIVTNVSPTETPLLTGLPTGQAATSTLHEYAQDSFADYSDNAQAEAFDFAAVNHSAPTRANNICQIFGKPVRVSRTEMKVRGVVDAWNYQLDKAMTEISKDIELAYMQGTRASGASGTARRMTGIIAALTSNATARASGSSLGEVAFNDIMALIYASTGEVATEVYVGATLKRDISGFTAGATKNVNSDDKRLTSPVSVYESDFGVHKIFLHRNVPSAANALSLVAINPKHHRKSWLDPIKSMPIAKTGDYESMQIVGEGTLEHLAKGGATGAYVTGFTS
jgi:hypothetical protein